MLGKKSSKKPENDLRTKAASRSQFSYYSSGTSRPRSDQATEASVDLGKPSRVRWLPTILSVTVILGCVLFSLTLSSTPRVEVLNENASPYRNVDVYTNAASRILGDSPSNLFKLTVNTSKVEDELLRQFPELRAAALRLPVLGRQPTLVLDIEPPAIILATPTKSFVLDESGTAISEVGDLEPKDREGLLVVTDQSGLAVENGKYALPSDTVAFVKEVAAHLKGQNLKIGQLTLPASANQLDIRLEASPYYVKTDVSGNARLQIGSFLAVKEKLERDRVTPSEYIDVRVEEKVFYR